MSFTHLQVRSGYSLLDSTITIPALVKRAQELQFTSLALTDEAVLYGVIPFYKACMQAGIKPIIGIVAQVEVGDAVLTCTFLAKNNQGYKNIMEISSHIQIEGSCLLEEITTFNSDIISLIQINDIAHFDELTEPLARFENVFPEVCLGVNVEATPSLIEKIQGAGYQAVALQDVRYLMEADDTSFACLQAMKLGEVWDPADVNQAQKNLHLRSTSEMEVAFEDYPHVLANTKVIAEQCNVTFDFEQHLLPAFAVPTKESAHDYLTRLCEEKLQALHTTVTPEMTERLSYELRVINELGFSDYFLIVADFVQFAKDENILVGPGRGSAAGAFVAYLLGITTVDPLEFDLLFERFLNPERVTMPDIDIDFSDVRRDEVIEYVRNTYGQDNVAQIITFGTYGVRSLLRELMKTMDIDHHDQAYILQQIPSQANESIVAYVRASEEFAEYIKQSPTLRTLFTVAVKLEGLPRHTSTHAAGIVIGQERLLNDVPLTKGAHDTYLSQYAMNELEAIGLLKIDILGLRNLSFMERILASIKRAKRIDIDINNLPMDDAKTFSLLQQGKTNGIFQLESAGMKRVLMQMQPTVFEDIVALNALYRPGPMDNIPTYIERKHGKKAFAYIHEDLEPILNKTYGVLVYQEQIMQIAHKIAGFSLGQADILRRAISKKQHQLMEEQHIAFVDGCIQGGYSREVGEEIFSWIVKFADYGFNKSHSVAYSKIGYQLSYLKANYPTEFFAQLFGSISNDAKKMNMYVREAMDLGIELLSPSINKSFGAYSIEQGKIRIGLLSIKGIGYEIVKEIIAVRKAGAYKDLFDFCLRTKGIKRNALETLILAGTFDDTYANRASLLASIDQALARAELFGDMNGQGNLFSGSKGMRPAYTEIADFTQMKKLADEKELLDMYVSSHPLKQYRDILTDQGYLRVSEVLQFDNNKSVKTAAFVQQLRVIKTKRGDSMAFITVADEMAELEGVIFPDVFREVRRWLTEESMVYLEGKVSIRQETKQIIVNKLSVMDLEKLAEVKQQKLYIRIEKAADNHTLDYLRETAEKHPGNTKIIIYNEQEKKTYQLSNEYTVGADETCLLNVMSHFGAKNVVLK